MEFIPHEIDGDVMILRAEGGLDASNASEFMKQVNAMAEGGFSRLIIDCVDLAHISSVGLGVLFRTHARAAKLGGEVKLCNVSGMPMQVLTCDAIESCVWHLQRCRSGAVVVSQFWLIESRLQQVRSCSQSAHAFVVQLSRRLFQQHLMCPVSP